MDIFQTPPSPTSLHPPPHHSQKKYKKYIFCRDKEIIFCLEDLDNIKFNFESGEKCQKIILPMPGSLTDSLLTRLSLYGLNTKRFLARK